VIPVPANTVVDARPSGSSCPAVKVLIDGATTSCSLSKGITFSGGVNTDANIA